jgi:hypothetical protein
MYPLALISFHVRRVLSLQDLRAALADNDGVGVREDGGDCEASGALDVHKEGAGSGHEGLELVLAGLTEFEISYIQMSKSGVWV